MQQTQPPTNDISSNDFSSPQPLCDVHTHPASMTDPDAYLQFRRKQGTSAIIAASASPDDWPKILALADRHHDVFPALGIHPWAAASLPPHALSAALDALQKHLDNRPYIRAISECGLDASKPNIAQQLSIFKEQCTLAREYHRIIIIHTFKSFHLLSHLTERDRVVFHGFRASPQIQKWALARGFLFSIGSAMLSKHPPILLPETAPFLLPESDDDGHHTANFPAIAQKLPPDASLRAITLFDLKKI